MGSNETLIILENLASLNRYGVAFLFSFGISWMICGFFWKLTSEKIAGYATLFQGLGALPIALFISYLMGALSQRPGGELFTQLAITLAMSQLLILPLIIVMQTKAQYTLIPFVFSSALTIHFVTYSWLYQTWLYIVMSVIVAVGTAVIYAVDRQEDTKPSKNAAAKNCFLTGTSLMATATIFLLW